MLTKNVNRHSAAGYSPFDDVLGGTALNSAATAHVPTYNITILLLDTYIITNSM